MPPPVVRFDRLGKAEKAAQASKLDETVEVGGRTMTKRALMEFEVEKRLGWGQSQSDIAKSLLAQGIEVDPAFLKERIAVAKRRSTALKPDKRYAGMEATWIIQNGLSQGKSWDEISATLIDGGFNGPRLVEIAKQKNAEQIQQGSGPAVIDSRLRNQAVAGGAGVAAGTGVAEGQEGLEPAARSHPTQDLKGLADMSQDELTSYLMEGFKEAKNRGLKLPESAAPTPMDWDSLEQLGQFWKEDIVGSNQVDTNPDLTEGSDTREGAARRPPPPETGVDLLIPGNNM